MDAPFADRSEAGRLLGARLSDLRGEDVVVLGLPRGGVPVAAEVAHALDAPLDVFVVRKLGAPGRPELAMGAIATGGVQVRNEGVVQQLGISAEAIDEVAADELRELRRREREYRGDRPPPEMSGRVVLLVDDGLATGSTMLAAVQAVRQLGPRRLVVAVPVGARQSCDAVAEVADEVVCLRAPQDFMAVGFHYEDFSQTSDDEVREALEGAGSR